MIRSSAILLAAMLFASACSQQKADTAAAVATPGETNSPAPAEVIAMEDPDEAAETADEMAAADADAYADAEPAAPGDVSDEERMLALAAIGLDHDPDGAIINDCGEAVEPDVHAIDMGGDVGRALLVVMRGGPTTAACYGDTGMKFFLLQQQGENFKTVASDMGHFALMETETKGVRDFAVGGPGFEFPVYEWNGRTFVSLRTIPDTELPDTVN